MSRSDSVKNVRFVFRIDARISPEKKSDFESWLAKRLDGRSQTAFALQSIETQIKLEDSKGMILPDDIDNLIDEYRLGFDVPPQSIDVIRKAVQDFVEKSRKK